MMRPALLLLLLLAAPHALAGDLLVPAGSDWLYLDDGSDQGTAWQAPAFVDGSWASGPAPLGYDNEPATTVSFGPDPNNKFITTYYRHHFNVAAPGAYTEGLLRVRRDDGAVVYLNGTEIFRTNIPNGAINSVTFANSSVVGADEYGFIEFPFPTGLLVSGDNVLAVEIHQRSATSSDTSFDLTLEGDTKPIVFRGPYLQQKTQSSIVVRWKMHIAGAGRVRYGGAPGNLVNFVDSTTSGLAHEVVLSGFSPSETVYYSIGTTTDVLAGDDTEHVFTTTPPTDSSGPVRIWVLGDSGEATAAAGDVRDAYMALPGADATDVWLMLGDNAYDNGSISQYQSAVFDTYPAMLRRTALWPTRGNHENNLGVYLGLFTLPTAAEAGGVPSGSESYYSFDHGNVHFLCLDSDGSSTSMGGAMYAFADADLAATHADWVIAFWHHPPYTKGSHDSDTEPGLIDMRTNILPLMEAHGVDLVLGGHSHSYERSMLIDGHYGLSGSFGPSHVVDGGDGDPSGNGAYSKGYSANAGTVFAVAGSGSKITGTGLLDHPVMVIGTKTLGSLVLDVDGLSLSGRFLDDNGTVADTFRIEKPEAWQDLGNGLAGGPGVPLLQGSGILAEGEAVTLSLTGALASSSAYLVLGFSEVNGPLKGGVLVPSPDFIKALPVNGAGAIVLPTTWPAGVPDGFESYFQYWVLDPAGPVGFSASNGLLGIAE